VLDSVLHVMVWFIIAVRRDGPRSHRPRPRNPPKQLLRSKETDAQERVADYLPGLLSGSLAALKCLVTRFLLPGVVHVMTMIIRAILAAGMETAIDHPTVATR
jgi:hypothetical protein